MGKRRVNLSDQIRQAVDASGLSRSEQRYGARDIVLIVSRWIPNRFPDLNSRREMHDGHRSVFPENLVELIAITDVAYLERAPLDKFGVTI